MDDLHILFVEDNPVDTELAVRELQKSGFDMKWQRVDTQPDFMNRLAQDPPDIIISDDAMPQFCASEALQCLRESRLTIPFIVLSHAIGEDEAVQLMRNGAADYLRKDRTGRLGEAVRHALEEQRLRSQYAGAQEELRLLNRELEKRVVERTAELEAATRAKAHELSERQQAEVQLRRLADTLEERVQERTLQLATSYDRLRALATDLTVAEQSARRKLATELHDYLAQLLVVTRMKVGQLLRQDHDVEVRMIVEDVDKLLHQSLDYTRSLVSELTPVALYERGLGAALQWLGDQMRRQEILNVEVSLDVADLQLPEADAVLLFQSVRELLFNVLKHGQTDRAAVSMTYAQNVLSLTVSDQGCGFNIEKLRNDRSDRFGLLSIRERMMDLGGGFDLQSEPGKGTVASLHLPCTPLDAGIEEPAAEGKQSAASEGTVCGGQCHPSVSVDNLSDGNKSTAVRILIVDDHQLVREGLHCLLKEYDDMTVVGEASTGQQALQLVGTLMPDVVIMDMQMPGWNGAEATRRILKQYPLITVIGLSVQTDPHVSRSMLEAGAAVFLPKEAINTDLYAAIRDAVSRPPAPKP
ncbi:MAG: response regulator [Nitrospira sp. CG24A]|nr:MAG: response regulator [Nitrospira sp. CG24A]